jgi:phytoene dehydrogenase-like protein
LEAGDRVGGSCRTEALTPPGSAHDVCSAIHSMAVVSPAFRQFELDRYGLQWVFPPALLAHPFDDGPAALLERGMTTTAASLGEDGPAWMKLFAPFVQSHEELFADILRPIHVPRAPWLLAASVCSRHGQPIRS